MSPLLSVIIPVYNVAPYIRKTLDSVVAASERLASSSTTHCSILTTHSTLVEVICVDDGSTDGSGAILDEYGKKVEKLGGGGQWSIKVLHQSNHGVSAARNAALDIATGEWVMMLDGDDTWHEDILSRLTAVIDDDLDCVGFSIECVNGNGDVIVKESRPKSKLMTCDELLGGERSEYGRYIWSACDKMFRRSVIESSKLRFRVDMTHAEDSLFTQMFLAQAGLIYLDSDYVGYRYCMRDGSAVHTKRMTLPSKPLADFELLHDIWLMNRRPGLLTRLTHIATGLFFLGKDAGFDDSVRFQGIQYLLNSPVFRRKISPFVIKHGTWRARLLAIACGQLPRNVSGYVLGKL